MPIQTLRARLITFSLFGLVIAALIFQLFPQIDQQVSRAFADPVQGGFPIGHQPGWKMLRRFFIYTTDGTVLVLILLLAHNWLRPAHAIFHSGKMGFVVTAYLVGPGLLVNGVLKSLWGRARPRDVVEFGGQHLFTPPLIPADQCIRNCSFVSGEVSAAATIALVTILLFWPRWRGHVWIVSMVAILYVAAAAALRIAFGGHFLSDTIFAALLMVLLVPVLHATLSALFHLETNDASVVSDG